MIKQKYCGRSVRASCHDKLLTCVYSYVPDKLTGLLESLSTMLAAVCEAAAIDVLLVIPGARRERPVGEGTMATVIDVRTVKQYQLSMDLIHHLNMF